MKKILLLSIAFLWITGVYSQRSLDLEEVEEVEVKDNKGKKVILYKKSYALLIGVSNYTNGWPSLPGVKKDVKEVKPALEKQGFQVEVVMDPNAEEMRKAFKDFIRKYGRVVENRLLFYFSGHGYTRKSPFGGETGYIVPKDAANPNRDMDGFLNKAMSMRQIEVYATEMYAKHALFLFDSCFSGSIFTLTKAVPEHISYKAGRPVRQFITSGSADEKVPDKSIFRQQFVEALSGEGDVDEDGYITGTELGEYLQKNVVNYSRGGQHPQYGKIRNPRLDKGDFVFRLPTIDDSSDIEEPEPEPIPEPEINMNKWGWRKYQAKMRHSYKEYQGLEKDVFLDEKDKAEAWQEFLTAFKKDNPHSTEDNKMREHASARKKHWESVKEKIELNVQIKGPGQLRVGDRGEYRITVENVGDATARNALVRAVVPRGMQYKDRKRGVSVRWRLSSLSAGDAKTYRYKVRALKKGRFVFEGKVELEGKVLHKTSFTTKVLEKKRSEPQVRVPRGFRYLRTRNKIQEYIHEATGMEFVLVPGGSFQMGSNDGDSDEKPVHKVTLKPFLIGKYEVTQKVWRKVMGKNPSYFKGDDHPVEQVSWDDIQPFLQRTGLELPTEAQWEYACRGGTQTKYYWGNGDINDYAWWSGNSGSKTHPVGEKKPNAYGLYDMSGNVWEWCRDNKREYTSRAEYDPIGPMNGSKRVYRGGCWHDNARYLRPADRVRNSRDYRFLHVGFRASRFLP